MSRKRNIVLLAAGLVAVVAVAGLVVAQPQSEAAQTQAQLDLVIEFPVLLPDPDPTRPPPLTLGQRADLVVSNIGSSGQDGVSFGVDSFFDVFYFRNIGSSGQDGVRYSAAFDSFFDVEYRTLKIETEMVALSLTGSYSIILNEVDLIDKAKEAALAAGGDIIFGHVTILK